MMCCQAPTPSPCSHRALQPHTSGTPPRAGQSCVLSSAETILQGSNSTHWNPTWKSGTGQWALEMLQQLRARVSHQCLHYSALWVMAVSPVQAPALLEHRLLSAHLPADLQYALSCKSHCQASLQCPRVRPPLRHNPPPPPTSPQQGQGRRNLYSIATSMAFPPCKPHFLSRLIYTLWSFHPLSSLTTQVFELT